MIMNMSPSTEHTHEWVVFSTALKEGWLMLQCVDCGMHGAVENPSTKEWSKGFQAPSRPYCWHDESRVTVKDTKTEGIPYVIRKGSGCRCECYDRLGVLEPREYERVPAEIINGHTDVLTAEERSEIQELAEFVGTSDLCSELLPLFLRSFQKDAGHRYSQAVIRIASRIEEIDRMGMHCSPSVVSRLLLEFSRQINGASPDDRLTGGIRGDMV